MKTNRYATIVSTGRYLPEIEVPNSVLREQLAHVPDFVDKMENGTGIRKRWYAPEGWATSDLVLPAARQALERAGRGPEDVDLIVVGTDSPDYITPATSVVVQHKLGAKNAGTFDVGCACASFPTGLAAAAGLIATNPGIRTVLVAGVYLMHKLADPKDPMIFFYGDGAGAAVLEPAAEPGFLGSAFQADGSYHSFWGIYSGGTFEPASPESVCAGRTRVRMVERYPPEINDQGWPKLVRRLAAENGFAIDEIDQLILTQVRKPTVELVMQTLGLPMDRTHTIMEEWGYTGSACVAMALDSAIECGKIGPGSLVVLVGSGVGYNQAGVAFRMPGELKMDTLRCDPGMNAIDWRNRRALAEAGFAEGQADSPAGRQTWFAAGSGQPLILLHGAGDNAGTWSKAAGPLLASGRYRVVIPDLAGHGTSEPAEGPLSMEIFLSGLTAVAGPAGTEPAILVGNSFGAWLAMAWTVQQPERVGRLVAVDGAAMTGPHADLSLTPATVEDASRVWRAVVDSSKWGLAPLVAGELVRKGREGALARFRAEPMLPYLMDGRLHEFPRPVDLIWGESDGLLPLEYARRVEAGLRAARLTTIPACGHLPQHECPEEFSAALAAVLAQAPPAERAP